MRTKRLPLHRKILYSSILCLGFFGFLELGLRLLHLGQPPILGKLQFGYDTGVPIYDSDGIEREGEIFQQVPLFERHHELFWHPLANTPFTGPLGFRNPEPAWQVDDAQSLTILILGDSCSFLGELTYPARLAELLQGQTHKNVRVYNASCPGYSSAQGVMRLKQLEALQPDLVIVYFGWNDHWRSLNGCTDRELIAQNQLAMRSQQVLRHFHFYWLVYSAVASIPRSQVTADAPMRVPLDEYEQNLKTIATTTESWHARTLFLTAPTAFQEGALPQWASSFFGTYYQMSPEQVQAIPKTHRLYNDVVREVARTERNSIVDLEKLLGHDATLFRSDCIHLTESGHARIEDGIVAVLRTQWPELLGH